MHAVRAHRRHHQADRRRRRGGQPARRHRRQALRPGRRRCSSPATSAPAPRPRRTPPTSIPAGIYAVAGLPVRRPDRAVLPPGTTPSPSTTSDSGAAGAGRPGAATAEVALLHRQPGARLAPPATTPTQLASIGCWIRRRRAAPPRPARSRNVAAPGPWDTSPRPARSTLDHGRQQRQHPRGVGQPADPGRPAPGADLADPRVHRRVHRRLEQLQVRPGPARPRAATTSTPSVDEPVRRAQPDARLLATTSASPSRTTTCSSTTSAAAASTATRRSATPRPARSPAASRRTSAGTTPTRSRCRTACPASPTSTSSSRSPARSTPRAPTAGST